MNATLPLAPYRHTQPGYVMWASLGVGALIALGCAVPSGQAWLCGLVALALVLALLLFHSLTVEVGENAVSFRFGLGWIHRRIPLADVAACAPVRNGFWHGWGIHYVGKGWVYNVSGFDAVELSFKNGRRLRIGTDDPQGLAQAVCARLAPCDCTKWT